MKYNLNLDRLVKIKDQNITQVIESLPPNSQLAINKEINMVVLIQEIKVGITIQEEIMRRGHHEREQI